MSQIPAGTLIIVVDGGSARVFTNVGSEHRLALRQQGELSFKQIDAQRARAQPPPGGEQPRKPERSPLNAASFTKQLAEQLNEDALNNRYAHLVLIADPQTLGRIRPLLHKQVLQRLLKETAKDLVHAPLHDIERALST